MVCFPAPLNECFPLTYRQSLPVSRDVEEECVTSLVCLAEELADEEWD